MEGACEEVIILDLCAATLTLAQTRNFICGMIVHKGK